MMFSLFTNKKQNELKNKREQLYRVAYSWCNDELLADDLSNETLYKALKKWPSLRDKSSVNSWLFKILANCWYDHLRKIKPSESIDDLVFVDHETPEQLLQQQEIVIQVRKAVGLLPMGQRQVTTLIDLEGFSYEEVATILSVPIGTVMSRLSRARLSLKESLLKNKMVNARQDPFLKTNIESKDNALQKTKLRSIQ